MKFKKGDLISFEKGELPCGIVIHVNKDKETLDEFREMLLEGDAIDIYFLDGKWKGVIAFKQDGGVYHKVEIKELIDICKNLDDWRKI